VKPAGGLAGFWLVQRKRGLGRCRPAETVHWGHAAPFVHLHYSTGVPLAQWRHFSDRRPHVLPASVCAFVRLPGGDLINH
jgi:hypothetical protein